METITFGPVGTRNVLAALRAEGLAVTWDYPGLAVIHVGTDVEVATGLNGWEYGSVSIIDADGCWQPAEQIDATPHFSGTTSTHVAAAWASWVAGFRASHTS